MHVTEPPQQLQPTPHRGSPAKVAVSPCCSGTLFLLGLCPQLRQLEMQCAQEGEEKQVILHEKQDMEGLVATLCEQVRARGNSSTPWAHCTHFPDICSCIFLEEGAHGLLREPQSKCFFNTLKRYQRYVL